MKIAKTFTKNPKINTIITGMLPREKTYSFQQITINEMNKVLKAECKSLPQIYFIKQNDGWVKSNIGLKEKFYFKYILHLMETGYEKN